MVLLPWLRRAENVVEVPRAEVVVRLAILMYFAAAAGTVVITAGRPARPGRYLRITVPESRSALGATVRAEISPA